MPKAILKWLKEEDLDIYRKVKGKKGAPNIWQIPKDLHRSIHTGRGWGGNYNDDWWDAILSLDEITPEIIFKIRDQLSSKYGYASWRPR